MQERRTRRLALARGLAERVKAAAARDLPLERVLPDVRAVAAIEEGVPASVAASKRKAWVDARRATDEEAALARIDGLIHPASEAEVALADGRLSFLLDEAEIARMYVGDDEAALVEAQWRAAALEFEPTGKNDAKRLVGRLRRVTLRAEPALADQIVSLGGELATLTATLRGDEAQLHELTCILFNLSDEERKLVEKGRG